MAKQKTEFVMIGVLPETREKARKISDLRMTTIYDVIADLVDREYKQLDLNGNEKAPSNESA